MTFQIQLVAKGTVECYRCCTSVISIHRNRSQMQNSFLYWDSSDTCWYVTEKRMIKAWHQNLQEQRAALKAFMRPRGFTQWQDQYERDSTGKLLLDLGMSGFAQKLLSIYLLCIWLLGYILVPFVMKNLFLKWYIA